MKQTNKTKWVIGHKITPSNITGDYDLVNGETPPGMPGPPPHTHSRFSEVFIITEGEMQFVLNGKPQIARTGDVIDLPPQTLHTFGNISDKPCKWINIHSPKGFLSFFEDTGVDAEEEDAQGKSLDPTVIEKVLSTAQEYDMNIVLGEKPA